MASGLTDPIVPVKCIRCGGPCLGCICALCPTCEPAICTDCPLDLEQIKREHGAAVLIIKEPRTVAYRTRLNAPQPGVRPRTDRCLEAEKEGEPVRIVAESSFCRVYQSEELIWDDARIVAGALKTILGFCAAGVVAVSCAVLLAAAVVFAGEIPE